VQTLMGYTAFLAGLVLAPGALAALFFFSLGGWLSQKTDNRYLLGIGLVIAAYSVHLMSQFDLSAGFWNIVWPRFLQGIGVAFSFVTLTVVTFANIPKEATGNATSIYGLLRNLGSSFGASFISTELERRAQFHQTQLVAHLTPSDIPFQQVLEKLQHLLPENMVPGSIYHELVRQASMLSFTIPFIFSRFFFFVSYRALLFSKRQKRLLNNVDMIGNKKKFQIHLQKKRDFREVRIFSYHMNVRKK
jgi:MFS transporter, DHA2 family, multidrug resistance protein